MEESSTKGTYKGRGTKVTNRSNRIEVQGSPLVTRTRHCDGCKKIERSYVDTNDDKLKPNGIVREKLGVVEVVDILLKRLILSDTTFQNFSKGERTNLTTYYITEPETLLRILIITCLSLQFFET